MTVKELIKRLEYFDQELEVKLFSTEHGEYFDFGIGNGIHETPVCLRPKDENGEFLISEVSTAEKVYKSL